MHVYLNAVCAHSRIYNCNSTFYKQFLNVTKLKTQFKKKTWKKKEKRKITNKPKRLYTVFIQSHQCTSIIFKWHIINWWTGFAHSNVLWFFSQVMKYTFKQNKTMYVRKDILMTLGDWYMGMHYTTLSTFLNAWKFSY